MLGLSDWYECQVSDSSQVIGGGGEGEHKVVVELLQDLVHHHTNGTEWMVLRNPDLQVPVAEERTLLVVVARRSISASGGG